MFERLRKTKPLMTNIDIAEATKIFKEEPNKTFIAELRKLDPKLSEMLNVTFSLTPQNKKHEWSIATMHLLRTAEKYGFVRGILRR